MLIRHYLKEGETKASVARRFNVSRPTVYRHMDADACKQSERAPRPSKLDPFQAYIDGRLEKYDLPATVLLQEIRKQGYGGGITILREYVRQIKEQRTTALVQRYETQPGEQGQIDWGECGTIVEDGVRKKLYVFVMVLGFSRMMFLRFTTSMKQHVLLDCLQEGFVHLGIPRKLMVDNMKQAVERHDVEQGAKFNAKFLDFCDNYGTLPVAAPPYWAQIKGKVERGVGYIKHSFLEGRSFVDLNDLNEQAYGWQTLTANMREHGTTKARPIDLHQQELPYLCNRSAFPIYDTRAAHTRIVGNDSHISYESVRYSVDPDARPGSTVVVRPRGQRIGAQFDVYCDGELVATHMLRPKGHRDVTLPAHQEKIRQLCKGQGRGRKRPRSNVKFQQVVREEEIEMSAPDVEERSLEEYEQFLSGGVA